MNDLLQFLADCWLPLLLAAAAGLALYHLGRAEERRRARRSLGERIRRHQSRSILLPLR